MSDLCARPSEHSLLATCRLPLAEVLAANSGQTTPKWHCLLRPPSELSSSSCGLASPTNPIVRLAGAVEVSAQLASGGQARRRILNEAVTRGSRSSLHFLHSWGLRLPPGVYGGTESQVAEFVIDEDTRLWDTGTGEFSLFLSQLKLAAANSHN